jgi:hypothetical protein
MRALLLCLLLAAPLSAQFHLGFKGGVPFNDAVKATSPFNSEFSRWTLGGVAELDLPLGFGVEFDLLYRRTGFSADTTEPVPGPDNIGNSWEFPLLLKYKFPLPVIRPYVAAGASFRKITDIPNIRESGAAGFVLSTGLRLNAAVVRISPELRYTRWNNEPFRTPGGSLGSALNQVEFLIGLTF